MHRFPDPDVRRPDPADAHLVSAAGEVFDALLDRGQIVIHASEVERVPGPRRGAEGLVDRRHPRPGRRPQRRHPRPPAPTGDERRGERRGERGRSPRAPASEIGVGDRVATRRNDRDLGVANRDTWTVTAVGGRRQRSRPRPQRATAPCPPPTCSEHVELAYATTVHGAQGETVDPAHLLLGETTGAAAAYVGMTRGRHTNTAHLVADTVDDAREQWVEVFGRDRADLGPGHADTPRRRRHRPLRPTGNRQRSRGQSPEGGASRTPAASAEAADPRPSCRAGTKHRPLTKRPRRSTAGVIAPRHLPDMGDRERTRPSPNQQAQT